MIEPRTTSPQHLRQKAMHLRTVAAAWLAEQRRLGLRGRGRGRGQKLRSAIVGALDVAREFEQEAGDTTATLEQRVVELHKLGLPFLLVARTLGVPEPTAYDAARRAKRQGVA